MIRTALSLAMIGVGTSSLTWAIVPKTREVVGVPVTGAEASLRGRSLFYGMAPGDSCAKTANGGVDCTFLDFCESCQFNYTDSAPVYGIGSGFQAYSITQSCGKRISGTCDNDGDVFTLCRDTGIPPTNPNCYHGIVAVQPVGP